MIFQKAGDMKNPFYLTCLLLIVLATPAAGARIDLPKIAVWDLEANNFLCNSLVPILPAGYRHLSLNCYTAPLEPLRYQR